MSIPSPECQLTMSSIFRLHRPWSTRGYHQPKYSYSTEACIKAASSVILSTAQIHEQVVGIYYVYSHVFGASLVLFNECVSTFRE